MFKIISNFIIVVLTILLFVLSYNHLFSSVKEEPVYKINIGFAPWPGFDILYYGQIKGIFKKHNIDVNLVRFQTEVDATKALQNLEIEAVMISIWDLLHIKSENDYDIVLVTDVSNGSDGIVASSKIKSIKDLKGKRVSVQKNSVNELILYEALNLHNMNKIDLKIFNISNEQAIKELFNENIDAAVLWEPLLSQVREKIDGNILFTTKDVDSLVVDMLVVQSKSVKQNKQAWHNFLVSWYEIMQDININKKEVFDIVSLKTNNLGFEKDYAGLTAGTIELNKEMFVQKRLEKSINKIKNQIHKHHHEHKAHININVELSKALFSK